MTGEKAPVRIAIRGFLRGVKLFERRIDVPEERLDALLPELAEEHAEAMSRGQLGMVEIEFVDDPDRDHAFFRIGTDPRGMTRPVSVALDTLTGDKRDVD